jgi:transposase
MAQTHLLLVKPFLTYQELTNRYRSCQSPREKSRWQLIWLMANPAKPLLVAKAAEIVGFCQRWARILVIRYNREGADGLIDKRKNNQGQEPILNEKQKNELRGKILHSKPVDGGLWTSVKVANWIGDKIGQRPNNRTGLNYLQSLGFTLQQPRASHSQKATPAEIKRFKKN